MWLKVCDVINFDPYLDWGAVHVPFYGVGSTRLCWTPALHASPWLLMTWWCNWALRKHVHWSPGTNELNIKCSRLFPWVWSTCICIVLLLVIHSSFEVICIMAIILFRPQCVNWNSYSNHMLNENLKLINVTSGKGTLVAPNQKFNNQMQLQCLEHRK